MWWVAGCEWSPLAVAAMTTLVAPRVAEGMPSDEYHASPALSSSGAKLLLPPSCPAKYRWVRDHGQAPKKEFDFGHAAHAQVLGIGETVVPVDAPDWRTKAAKEAAAAARAAGAVPLLVKEWQVVQDMAAALRAHPIAGPLFTPGTGRAELSLFWHDDEFDVQRRARLDWLRPAAPGKRALLVDYKSTNSAEPDECAYNMNRFGYHRQLPFYLDGIAACGLGGDLDPAGLVVWQEKTAPYLITVTEPDVDALAAGRDLNRKALDVFARCTAAGVWPGYANPGVAGKTTDDSIVTIGLPRWAAVQHETALGRGDFDTAADAPPF